MKHGSNCDCMMCSTGKKMGIIKKPQSNDSTQHSHDHDHDHDHDNNNHE